MTLPKKAVAYIVAGALCLVLALALIRAFDLGADNRFYQSQYRAQAAAQRLANARRDRERALLEADKEARDREIAALRQTLIDKDAALSTLSGQVGQLEGNLADAQTDAERVPILTALVATWTERFTIADSKCREYEGIIFALTEKYYSQVRISESWEAQYQQERTLREWGESVTKSLRGDLRLARFSGTVKSAVVLGLAGYVAFHLISGK